MIIFIAHENNRLSDYQRGQKLPSFKGRQSLLCHSEGLFLLLFSFLLSFSFLFSPFEIFSFFFKVGDGRNGNVFHVQNHVISYSFQTKDKVYYDYGF